jgi:hypothetical protein
MTDRAMGAAEYGHSQPPAPSDMPAAAAAGDGGDAKPPRIPAGDDVLGSTESAHADTTTVPPGPATSAAPTARTGRGAVVIALIALLISALALLGPAVQPDLARRFGANLGVAPRDGMATGGGIEDVAKRQAAFGQRIDAIEASLRAMQQPPAPAGAESIEELRQRLDGLAQRIAHITAPAGADQTDASQSVRVDALDRRLADLTARIAALAAEQSRFAEQITTARAQQRRSQALWFAIMRLQTAVQSSRPYASELDAVRNLASGDGTLTPPLDALLPYASRGVPVAADLRDGFHALAPILVDQGTSTESAWGQRALLAIKSLLAHTGAVDEPQSAIATLVGTVERHLARGQVDAAVAELAPLDGPALALASGWLTAARIRLTVDQAASDLASRAVALRDAPP